MAYKNYFSWIVGFYRSSGWNHCDWYMPIHPSFSKPVCSRYFRGRNVIVKLDGSLNMLSWIFRFLCPFLEFYGSLKLREKGRDLTQSYDKSPYTNRNVKRAKWQHKQRHKKVRLNSGCDTIQKWRSVRLCYCFTPYQRLWLYNGAPLVAYYDTVGIRRTYSRLELPASSWGCYPCCFSLLLLHAN